MKKLRITTILGAAMLLAASCSNKTEVIANYDVIPLPDKIEVDSAAMGFMLDSGTKIVVASADSAMTRNAELLSEYLGQLTGTTPEITAKETGKAIVLSDDLASDNKEAYELTVSSEKITINGASPAGTFYGIQTLRKSIPQTGDLKVLFPAATITDAPRFAYRGAHFDTARHFFPADSVKVLIDMMAMHNINRFHWHITDDQGWRIEIGKYPELVAKGSTRPNTVIGHNTEEYDTIPHGGYYTKEQIRDIVRYAADRHITIIPEIDMPGHMLAALAAYPELGCTGGPYEVWRKWGISDDVLCAGNDSVYAFVNDVLDEIVELFPGEYVHLGGDECPKTRWKECAKCQARIKALGLKTDKHSTAEQKLQSYFMTRAAEHLAAKGRKVIGWDEIMEGGLTPGSVIMSWRGEVGGRAAAEAGHDAIMTPYQYLYFDFVQSADRDAEPLAASWGDPTPVEKVYNYEPVPAEFTPEQAAHILGAQANTWTEYIPTTSYAQYMMLPRLAALSEVQWRDPAKKDYQDFLRRLPQLVNLYDANHYNYATHVLPSSAESTDSATTASK